VSYHVGREVSLVLVATSRGAAWRKLPRALPGRLEEANRRLAFQWGAAAMASASGSLRESDPLTTAAEALLRDLHRRLWKPVRELGARPRRWLVAPHGAAHGIPFHALFDGDAPLVQEQDFTYVPSATIASRLSRRASRGGRRAWVAATPSARLAAVGIEVERVAARLRGFTVTQTLAPTHEAFRREAVRADLIHLAAHGGFHPENPAFSFVQLVDGPLYLDDLRDLRFRGTTVVLSACLSGAAQAPAGEEWIGFGRTFLQSGARAAVVSLWPIEDRATSDLMDHFYESHAAGSPPSEALGEAMRRMRSRRSHPWHWASFAVLGGIE
jgi:CHAT domain-containing protein